MKAAALTALLMAGATTSSACRTRLHHRMR